MKLGNWIAGLGCLGLGVGAVIAGQGCTATLTVGPCDGGCVSQFPGDDSAVPVDTGAVNEPDTSVADASSTPPDPCNTCLYGECVGAYSNCVSNSSCLGIYQCATSPACAADGGSCVQDCYNAGTPLAKSLYLALGTCDQAAECTNVSAAAACALQCNPAPATCTVYDAGSGVDSAVPDDAGTDAGTAADASPLTCSQCQAASCSPELAACAAGTPCATYQQCLLGCASAACNTACETGNQPGVTAATALGTCTTTNCPQCSQ